MKLNKLLWGLAVLGLASCSADKTADDPVDPNQISDGTVRYMALSISNNTAGSRAETYEESLTDDANERVIKKIRIYFFDASGKAAACKSGNPTSTNFYDVLQTDIVQEASAMDNIDMTYQAVVVIATEDGDVRPAQMVALVNVPDADYPTLTTGTSTIEDLEKIVSSYAYTTQLAATSGTLTGAGLAMASSVYKSGTTKTYAASVPVALYTTEDQAKANPVEVYVERVNAKVRMKLGTSFAIANANAKSDASKTVNDITVYNVKDNSTDNNNVTVNIGAATKEILVNFGGWYVTAEMPKSFLIKHISGSWADDLFTDWNKAAWHRSFWAVNPSMATDPRTADDMRNLDYKTYKADGNDLTGDANYVYVQENAADALDGTKVTQWAASTAGLTANDNHCTKVLVKATIGYKDDSDVFVPLDYAEWAGQKYVVADGNLETAMLGSLNYWIVDETKGTQTVGSTKYRKIGPSDVKVVTASGSDLTNHVTDVADVAQEKRYKCHLVLKTPSDWSEVYEITGEGAGTTATEIDVTGMDDDAVVNDALAAGAGDIKYWKGGLTYYFFDIKHLAAGATDKIDATGSNAAGKFGVVRNHVYECTVNGVYGLGTPVYDPDEVVIPEKVTDEESFVAVQLKVLSWRVVSNNVNLGE